MDVSPTQPTTTPSDYSSNSPSSSMDTSTTTATTNAAASSPSEGEGRSMNPDVNTPPPVAYRTLVFNIPIYLMLSSHGIASPVTIRPSMMPFQSSFEEVLQQSFLYHQRQQSGPSPATQSQLDEFVKEGLVDHLPEGVSSSSSASMCTVCQMNFELGEKMITLPCNHCYHTECGMTWLKQHNSCPLCRAGLPPSSSSSSISSSS